jgi:hypothetical protein
MLRNQSVSKASYRAIVISLPDWLMPGARNLPDLLAWSRVACNQDMPHFTQTGPEPAMTRSRERSRPGRYQRAGVSPPSR